MGRTPERHVILVLAIAGTALVAMLCKAEQPPDKTDWGNLGQLAQGARIRVVLNDGRSFTARFETFTEEVVVVSVATRRSHGKTFSVSPPKARPTSGGTL